MIESRFSILIIKIFSTIYWYIWSGYLYIVCNLMIDVCLIQVHNVSLY